MCIFVCFELALLVAVAEVDVEVFDDVVDVECVLVVECEVVDVVLDVVARRLRSAWVTGIVWRVVGTGVGRGYPFAKAE
jgi:hypothetical protein